MNKFLLIVRTAINFVLFLAGAVFSYKHLAETVNYESMYVAYFYAVGIFLAVLSVTNLYLFLRNLEKLKK